MFTDYYKIKTNVSNNDSALISCLKTKAINEGLFKNWIGKESNLKIDDKRVIERYNFICEQHKKLQQLDNEQDKKELLSFLARLLSSKFSGRKQSEFAISLTIDKLIYCFVNKKPIIFVFGYGGYKNYNSPSFPEVDWAELFHMKYMTTFLWPIIKTYKYGVKFEYESEEISIQFNNVPQETTDRYTKTFGQLLKYFCNKIEENNGVKIDYSQVIARNMYTERELYNKMNEYYKDMEKIYNELPDDEKMVWFKRAKTNFLVKGTNDYSNCSAEEINNLIIKARINNECFLAADYDLRIEFWERPNAISLFGTWGKTPCASPTDGGLHLKSTASSNTDFWIGTGVLKLDKDNKIIQEQILSTNQYEENKALIQTIHNNDQELRNISKNFDDIKFVR